LINIYISNGYWLFVALLTLWLNPCPVNFDESATSLQSAKNVIPAKAGIQLFQGITAIPVPCLRLDDDLPRLHRCWLPKIRGKNQGNLAQPLKIMALPPQAPSRRIRAPKGRGFSPYRNESDGPSIFDGIGAKTLAQKRAGVNLKGMRVMAPVGPRHGELGAPGNRSGRGGSGNPLPGSERKKYGNRVVE